MIMLESLFTAIKFTIIIIIMELTTTTAITITTKVNYLMFNFKTH